jgi:hypothetical protein
MPILTRYCTEGLEKKSWHEKEPLKNKSEDRARKYAATTKSYSVV